ncbi:hypothetical protein TWF694_000849 [Orbilia ellipsospora]|uniref:Uncharacterized protein n=1 Tax=Orbilia ellipsospora TaxID=2528407 RepID=A0AAV9XPV0_9PEZI
MKSIILDIFNRIHSQGSFALFPETRERSIWVLFSIGVISLGIMMKTASYLTGSKITDSTSPTPFILRPPTPPSSRSHRRHPQLFLAEPEQGPYFIRVTSISNLLQYLPHIDIQGSIGWSYHADMVLRLDDLRNGMDAGAGRGRAEVWWDGRDGVGLVRL